MHVCIGVCIFTYVYIYTHIYIWLVHQVGSAGSGLPSLQINFRRRPPPAQLTEWTRVRDCARFHALNVFAGVGSHIFAAAASGIRGKVAAAPDNVGADADALVTYLKETDFAQLVGKRANVVRQVITPPSQNIKILMSSLILDAIELVTEWYLGAERLRLVDDSHPPLMHVLWGRSNPAIWSGQFLAAVLTCEHSLGLGELAYQVSHGDIPHRMWVARNPQEVAHVRSSIAFASAWLWLRHVRRWEQWPWALAIVADDRRPPGDKQAVADKFFACRDCPRCVDVAHSRRLQSAVRSGGASWLLQQRSVLLHMEFAKLFDLQTDDRERKHAVHKKHFPATSSHAYFMSRSFILDAKEVSAESLAESAQTRNGAQAGAEAEPEEDGARARCFKNVTTYWHHKCVLRDLERGLRTRVASTQYHQACKAEFEALTPQQQQQEVDSMQVESDKHGSAGCGEFSI